MTEPAKKKDIFRPEALEGLASSRRFEETLQVISYKKWLTRGSFVLIAIGTIIWLIWGSIPIEARGVGIAVNEKGLYNLDTAFSGFVQQLYAPVGTEVKTGDLLALLDDPELDARQKALQQTVDKLTTQLAHLRQEISLEKNALVRSLEKGVQATEFKIGTLEKDIPFLEEDVRLKRLVASKGLLDSDTLRQMQELLWSKKMDIEKSKTDLMNLHFLLKKEYRHNEITLLEEHLREISKEKALIDAQLRYNHIYSPIQGKILEWFVQPQNYVSKGELIARLELDSQSSSMLFYGYLPIENKKIALNATVKIELTTVKPQEYGAMLGHITRVSQHAVSPEFLTRMIHNPALIDYLLQKKGGAVFEVVIEPERDPTTPSGYRWTSGKGPDIQLTSGTLCLFNGLIEEISPLYYFFPVWWVKQKVYANEIKE